ncbi:SPOR domain-containing protein [Pararhodobacter sp. SW119]|uniref:SPOR domain-containing protein n=1 Tax=Pararhodobacter sp. SW119 TaxID=2780075 RepID=UPI001AE05A88|nr:SPOR domain-containing protein [Pararhodobacter sp. SW119]
MTEWHGYPHAAAQAHHDASPSLGARLAVVANWTGALISVALLAGVGVWSYRLMVRDISGVPVVRALDGPMRISPEDPGGRQAAYQGLAVNAVAAGETPPPAADAVALAPEPVALAPEDRPPPAPSIETPRPVPELAATAERAEAQDAPPIDDGTDTALVEIVAMSADVPGIARSPFPLSRPTAPPRFAMARGQPQPVSDAEADDAEAEALLELLLARLAPGTQTEIDPETLPVGTRLVQLGAFPDEVGARDAWEALSTQFAAAFDGRARVIEPAVSAGRTIYRLRAHGFADEPEARRFCALLVAEGADCIPVLIR